MNAIYIYIYIWYAHIVFKYAVKYKKKLKILININYGFTNLPGLLNNRFQLHHCPDFLGVWWIFLKITENESFTVSTEKSN